MSRVHYFDIDSTEDLLAAGRWERNSQVVFTSKAGRRALGELLVALEALPEKRLIADALCLDRFVGGEAGAEPEQIIEVCAVGAWALHKGMTPERLASTDCGDASCTAQELAPSLGATMTLVANIIEMNDETFEKMSPEKRYSKMVDFIRDKLAA